MTHSKFFPRFFRYFSGCLWGLQVLFNRLGAVIILQQALKTSQHNEDTSCASWLLGCHSSAIPICIRVYIGNSLRWIRKFYCDAKHHWWRPLWTYSWYYCRDMPDGYYYKPGKTQRSRPHETRPWWYSTYRDASGRTTCSWSRDHHNYFRGRPYRFILDWKWRSGKMQCVDFPVKDFWLKKFSAQKREEFTRSTITQSLSKYPHFNWVICHSPYSVAFDGVEGTDYGHYHYELKISFGRTIGSVHLTLSSIYSFLITF